MLESVLLMFSSKSFIVSGLIFRSLIHFEFSFVYSVRKYSSFILSHVQFSSVAHSCPTLCDPVTHSTPGLPVHHQLSRSSLKLTYIKLVMPSSHLILCCPLLLLPPIPPIIRVFPMSQLFAGGGQSTGVSASASFPS